MAAAPKGKAPTDQGNGAFGEQNELFDLPAFCPILPPANSAAAQALHDLCAGDLTQLEWLQSGSGWRLAAAVKELDYLGWEPQSIRVKCEGWDQDMLGVKPRRTWNDAAEKFLQETSHKRTHEWDKSMLRWFLPHLVGKELTDINRAVLDQVRAIRGQGSSTATVNRYMALVRTILRKACNEWEWIDRVPKVGMFRDQEGRIRSLTRDEFARLIAELPEHLADMAQFSVATGLRQANVTRLQWKQISLERRHLWVSGAEHKNGRPHSVPLNQAALDVLEKRKGDHQTHVFTYEGNPIVQVNTKAWRNALQRAGIHDFRWHDLRHTFATWHREAGTPTHELQRLGGWKTQSMVERYAHVAPEGLQFAANRLDSLMQACGVSQVLYRP